MKQKKRQARAKKERQKARKRRHLAQQDQILDVRINEPYLTWLEKGWLRQS